ncbi:TonB-dependent receptor [Acetobacter lambici]|uniref:TonB-dependent receptor n=1 Tax=Acetobacter lambici TaxID=1332824 RepID=A0ABT1EZ47_9PROT|nr:TonB-dependent receptor [Acetobacter lambici]MCP1242205.1 TonB-dependent receptor [Acetobacter lambici]MCP1258222.1 TonB-dependent receptor [Acetobacter lambici]
MPSRFFPMRRSVGSPLTYRQRLATLTCLAGVAGFCASVQGVGQASAATTDPKAPVVGKAGHSSAKASAAHTHAKPANTSVQASGAEEISVASNRTARSGGGGMMRQEVAPHAVQTVTKAYINMRSPTSTPLDLVKNLPSMNVMTPDASGMQGGSIQSRGLTDLDMALMVDGAPAAAAKYMTEDIDSENLDEVSVTPGSAARDLPVMSAAGGVMNSRTHMPSDKMGGMVDFSYGTNNLSREFIRLESGEIGKTGVKGYFSFSNTHDRSWMGAGSNQRKHIDFGVRKDWENGSNAHLFLSWNSEDFVIDNYPTADQFYKYKHTGEGYGRSADSKNVNYWRNNNDHWNQIFLTAPVHIVLPKKLTFDIQPYFSFGQGWDASPGGQADGTNSYVYNSTGTNVAAGTNLTSYFLENEARQVGAVAKLGYDIDRHNHLSFGYWYENNQTIQSYPTATVTASGAASGPTASGNTINGPVFGQTAGYELHSLFIQNQSRYLNDRLLINAGFKFVMSNAWNKSWSGDSKNMLPGASNSKRNNTTEPLPQLSISYQINENNQIYVNAEGDYRQPSATDMGWMYTSKPMLKNQYSVKEELGYRFHNKYVMIDMSLFNYNVKNRIVDQYMGMNSFSPMSIGSQTMRGFDFMIAGTSYHGFSPYASVEYLHATQDSNVWDPDNSTMIHSKGTQAIMAPRVMANFGLTYTYKGFFANGAVHYTGPQSVSIADDQRIPGYVTNTLSLGYHFKPFGFLKSPTFKLNFTNLTGSIVRTGAMGAVYTGSDRNSHSVWSGSNGAGTGYGNSFMVEPRFTMVGSVSTSF